MPAEISSWPLQCGFTPGGAIRPGHFSEQLPGHAANVRQRAAAINGKSETA
jgi:hypothetical protein